MVFGELGDAMGGALHVCCGFEGLTWVAGMRRRSMNGFERRVTERAKTIGIPLATRAAGDGRLCDRCDNAGLMRAGRRKKKENLYLSA